jgi:hypothetical protein
MSASGLRLFATFLIRHTHQKRAPIADARPNGLTTTETCRYFFTIIV